MRLGLIGTVGEHLSQLDAIAAFGILKLSVDALVYLGNEPSVISHILDRHQALEDPAGDEALWERADACVHAEPQQLSELLRELRRTSAWTRIELLGTQSCKRLLSPRGDQWLLCADPKAMPNYDTEDATLVAFGDSDDWQAQSGEKRILLAPGSLARSGLMLVDDSEGLNVEVYDRSCSEIARRHIESSRLPQPRTP